MISLGRKRTKTKKNINLYVEKDLIDRLKILELNASVIFTKAAQKELKRQEELTREEKIVE